MSHKTIPFLVIALLSGCVVSCGRHKLSQAEIERNRLFSEIVKRSDRRALGDDAFFPRMLLSGPYTGVAQWSAIALGRIGDPRALPWLYAALNQQSATSRACALFALGEIEDRDTLREQGLTRAPGAVARVRALLYDSAPAVRMRAVEALGKIGDGDDAAAVSAAMAFSYRDASPETRALLPLAITALMRLGQKEQFPVLRTLAAAPDAEIRWRALNALFRVRDQGACTSFRAALRSSDPDVRAQAARGLGICAASDADVLLRILSEPAQPEQVRTCALRALGDLRNPGAVPAIARAALDSARRGGANFAAEAADALGRIGSREAVAPLCELLNSHDAARDAALVALARVLRDDPDRFFAATRAMRFADPAALRARARSLGELGGTRALQELRSLVRQSLEPSENSALMLALPTLIASLAGAHDPGLPDITTAMMRLRDGAVLRAALSAYAPPAGVARPWQPVAECYAALAPGADVETKAAVLNRLAPWASEPEVRRTLQAALRDRSRNARVAAARILRGAGSPDVPDDPGPAETTATDIIYDLAASARRDRTVATIETDRGEVEFELFREDAPLTVANFVQLARAGFYKGLSFMRVVPYFVIQGGDPRNDQEGGPGYAIRCEINMRPFERGSVGMALAGKDTGGSQFFITLAPQPHLDGAYTCFGRVIAGMSVVDRITAGDKIRSVTISDDVTMIDFRRY